MNFLFKDTVFTNSKGNLIRTNEMSIIVTRVNSSGHSEGKTETGKKDFERLADNRKWRRKSPCWNHSQSSEKERLKDDFNMCLIFQKRKQIP